MLANAVRFGARFGIGIALARLLPPEDFGIVGLALIATGFASTLADLGLGPALVQRQTINERHIRVCHTLSFLVSVVMTVALYAVAGFAAEFFADTRVEKVLQVLSFTFVLNGFAITSNSLMVRGLLFKTLVKIQIIGSVIGYGAVSVLLAWIGYGYWSLVWGTVAQTALSSVLTFGAQRHPLVPSLAREELRNLFRFSMGMSVASTINYLARQGDYFVIGRLMNATSLGLYTRAFSLMELPHTFVGSALSRVLFPAAARLQSDPERFQRAYVSTLSLSVAGALPLSIAVVILAPELIRLLYGPNWLPVIPLVQILSLFGVFRMSYNTAGAFVRAKGHAFQIVLCQLTYAAMVVMGSWWAGATMGLEGVAWAVGLAMASLWVLIIHYANMAAGLSWRAFFHKMGSVFAVTSIGVAGASLAVYIMRRVIPIDVVVLVVGGTLFGLITVWSLMTQVDRLRYTRASKIISYLRKVDLISRIVRFRLRES